MVIKPQGAGDPLCSDGGWGRFIGTNLGNVYTGNGTTAALTINPINYNSNYIVSWQWNGTNSTTDAWVNGQHPAALPAGTTANGITNTYIGYNFAFSTSPYKGYIGEIIIFERLLSTSERQDIESYLSKKWGIKLG